MASSSDQDKYFKGQVEASIPYHLTDEGTVTRVINGRFFEGTITNAIGFDELEFTYAPKRRQNSDGTTLFASPVKYQTLIQSGDVQLCAPLSNITGKYLICVISGRLLRFDLATLNVTDITPVDAHLPKDSFQHQLSFTDNDGGMYGVGGYLVIFNYPNKSILIGPEGARLANEYNYEVPPSRLGATAGSRLAIVSSDNIMYVSDPLGGANPLAPLTFEETLDPTASYYAQVYNIGSVLDLDYVTAVCRLPSYSTSSQDFLAQQLLVSTKRRKYLVAIAAPRDTWDKIQFISYIGSSDGIAGPHACTIAGSTVIYISTQGRIKTIGQDQERDVGLSETFLDDPLGQYLCRKDTSFQFRPWYRTLDHSRSIVKFANDRLYATVYPALVPSITSQGDRQYAPTHQALAVASLDSTTRLGPTAAMTWEGFYDWLRPIGLVNIDNQLYVISKDDHGRIRYYKENFTKVDEHMTTVYTRGYLSESPGYSRSLLEGDMYFKKLAGQVEITVSYLVDDFWIEGSKCVTSDKLHRFSFRTTKCKTDAPSIPLRIEIDHKGCRFELSSIRMRGEVHREEKK